MITYVMHFDEFLSALFLIGYELIFCIFKNNAHILIRILKILLTLIYIFKNLKFYCMKKVLLAVMSLLAVSASSFAQEANAGDFNIGIVAGGGLSNIRMDDQKNVTYERKSIANIQGGVVIDYAFVDNFFLEAGATFQRKGNKQTAELQASAMGISYSTKSTMTANMFYVEVPVTLNYRIPIGDMGLIPQAGPYVAFGVGGKTKSSTEFDTNNETIKKYLEQMGSEDSEYDSFGDDGAEKLDFGVRLGLGLAFSEKLKFTVGYDLGLLDNVRGDNVDFKNKNGVLFGTLTFYIK